MTAQPLPTRRFLRKTTLSTNEYNTNFQMIDRDILEIISSSEADKVTPLMSKIYLRLLQTPKGCLEGQGVLRFEGEIKEGKRLKAWDQLCKHLCVSSETANKALAWLHEQSIIGYSAFKNGVGIRIFLNRAVSSIGVRTSSGGKNFLPFSPASESKRPASESETTFIDSSGDQDSLESDLIPRAPENGADTKTVDRTSPGNPPVPPDSQRLSAAPEGRETAAAGRAGTDMIPVDEIVRRLHNVLEPSLDTAAVRAARREHELTREWLNRQGIPKAVRVAQREAYNVLRSHGLVNPSARRATTGTEVGRSSNTSAPPEVQACTPEEITELAESCVALLEAQGRPVEVTLAEVEHYSTLEFVKPDSASLTKSHPLLIISHPLR
jgi:hypothetical protein